MPNTFAVDFETVTSSYVRVFSVRNLTANTPTVVVTVRPPRNWEDIVFKQLNRKIYYEYPHCLLDWEDGDIPQEGWLDKLLSLVSYDDVLMVNNVIKQFNLEQLGFHFVYK